MRSGEVDLNLRHLRAFVEVARAGSISHAADAVHLSQPAITHGISSLENRLRAKLFIRGARGMSPTEIGANFSVRVERALTQLNSRLPRQALKETVRVENRATAAQLRVLIAISETASYSAAARALGAAQPTIYRSARDLEASLGAAVYSKTNDGVYLTRLGDRLVQNARLTFAELEQGLQEIQTSLGEGPARIRAGALPLARATVLPRAIDALAMREVRLQVYVDDGPYSDLLQAVRSGALDLLVGALRDPSPAPDIVQELLFSDRLGVFCAVDHPLRGATKVKFRDLGKFPWIVPREGTPTRRYFESALGKLAEAGPDPLIETSSMILVRELLQSKNRLTLISRAQVATEVRSGLLFELPVTLNDPPRPIGIAHRANWYPTAEQQAFVEALRSVSQAM